MKTKEGMIGQLFKSGGFSVEIGDKIVGTVKNSILFPKVKLPRKVKKAARSFYWRNTKWKRRWERWLLRNRIRHRGGEMTLTKEARDRIEKMINFSEHVWCGKVSADTLLKALINKKI